MLSNLHDKSAISLSDFNKFTKKTSIKPIIATY